MSVRAPSTPPQLEGFRALERLGSGGFADVFAYEQQNPRRTVAVKVLLRDLGIEAQRHFVAEADLMAMLSNHPSIVSIYAADVAADGRPYLVMEMCQQKHLGARLRQRPIPLVRALEIGIQIAGAVETAHRLGILHRDIKPANILFTEFGRPALTDFGISTDVTGGGAAAFSVMWAPPEQIAGAPTGPSGDVYSLAATVWAMLAGRNPFDVPGDNDPLALASRVRSMPVPPTGRADVPESLERILRTALAKQPTQRYGSALELARALQSVQAELHQSVTTIDVREDRTDDEFVDETENGTRVTGFLSIDPDVAPERTISAWFDVSDSRGTRPTGLPTDPGAWTSPTDDDPHRILMHGRGSRPATGPVDFTGPAVPLVPDEDTAFAGSPAAPGTPAAPASRRRMLPVALGIGTALVVLVLGVVWVLSGRGPATAAVTPSTAVALPADPIGIVAPVEGLEGAIQGDAAEFTWSNPDGEDGDVFLYRPVIIGELTKVEETSAPTATLELQRGQTCIEVTVVRNGRASEPVQKCADA